MLYCRLALPSWNSAADCLQRDNDTPSMPPLVPVGSVRYILLFKRCCFSWTLSKTEFWKPVICRVLEVNLTTSGGGLGVFYSILQIFYTSHLTLMYCSADRLCSPQTVAVITTYKSKQCQVIISNPQGLQTFIQVTQILGKNALLGLITSYSIALFSRCLTHIHYTSRL